MNSIDTLAGIVLGVFFLAVAVQGNSSKMIDLAKRDKSFLQWAIALGVLLYLHSIPELKGVMSMLIFISLVGLAITSLGPISQNAQAFWASLKG